MLLGRPNTVRNRIGAVLFGTAAAALPVLIWYTLASLQVVPWPQASSQLGVGLGLAGAALIFFEMAIAPRKWFRSWRLGATKRWMRWHIWLGLAVLPMIVIHSGFAWGGWLSATTMILFLIVIASGIHGLILQQWLPKKIFDEIPYETVASQIEFAVGKHVRDADRVFVETDAILRRTAREGNPLEAETKENPLEAFYAHSFDPYLRLGTRSGSALASATESARLFARLRTSLPAETEPNLAKLEKLADLRRQWDRQAWLNWWLHNWLLVHLPVSVLMTGLMIIHAAKAMRWW